MKRHQKRRNFDLLRTDNTAQDFRRQLRLLTLVACDVGAAALQRVRRQGFPVEEHHEQGRRVLPEVGDLRDALIQIPGHSQALREVQKVTILLMNEKKQLAPTLPWFLFK